MKAALVIGVDKTGRLPKLAASARSAEEVGDWLDGEGFDVTLLTDSEGSVNAADVKRALASLVTVPPRYELLVIYFSGHGFRHARSDRWLMSGAPRDPDDAINLVAAVEAAKYSGIRTVVFVSDACRVPPKDAVDMMVDGIVGFPNHPEFQDPSKVDTFKAAPVGKPAFEIKVPKKHGGDGRRKVSLLTTAWRAAYSEATPDMVNVLDGPDGKFAVVPNRQLEDFVQTKVDWLIDATDLPVSVRQSVDINVPSSDDVFIARAQNVRVEEPAGGGEPPQLVVSNPLESGSLGWNPFGVRLLLDESRLDEGTSFVGNSTGGSEVQPSQFSGHLPRPDLAKGYESDCGFVFASSLVERVAFTNPHAFGEGSQVAPWNPDYPTEHAVEWWEHPDAPGSTLVRVWPQHHPTSVVVGLTGGPTIVAAALPGYIGHVAVDGNGLHGVSYVPAEYSENYRFYSRQAEKIDNLRALLAVATDSGRFRVDDDEQARALGARLRVGKSLDPSLGLYAAYAYSAGGFDEDVADVLRYMESSAPLFDISMLASRVRRNDPQRSVPFCPLLTQGWNALRPREIILPDALAGAEKHLLESSWTAFDPAYGQQLHDLVANGGLQ